MYESSTEFLSKKGFNYDKLNPLIHLFTLLNNAVKS